MRSRLAFKNVRPEDWGLRQKASQVYARGELAGNWQATGAPIHCHPAEVIMPVAKIHRTMSDGEEIAVGGGAIRAMHTPGHTPGSTCYLAGRILFSGDVLFPGGPGRTQSPADLQQHCFHHGAPLRVAR